MGKSGFMEGLHKKIRLYHVCDQWETNFEMIYLQAYKKAEARNACIAKRRTENRNTRPFLTFFFFSTLQAFLNLLSSPSFLLPPRVPSSTLRTPAEV